jgi:molybdate transport system substrate-binding protein
VRILSALVLTLLTPSMADAHRLDEYLQAARIAVTLDRLTIEMSLTPGVSLADATIARLDGDGDGTITPDEAERYGRVVVADLRASIDGDALALSLRHIDVPTAGEFREGVGTIRLISEAPLPAVLPGSHVVRVENQHRPAGSVYLANALLPDDARIEIGRQVRDPDQQVLDVHFETASSPGAGLAWLVVAGALLLVHARSRLGRSSRYPWMTWITRMARPSQLTLAVAVAFLAVVSASAGEVRVMTSGAFAAAHLALSPRFEAATGETVVTVTTTTGVGADAIPSRIRRGEAVDVVILPDAALEQSIKDGLIVAGSRVALARSAIGMAVRAGAPKPDISSVDALRSALLGAKSVAYSASVSGEYLSKELFPRLGIADEMRSKSLRIERERVGAVVARGEAEIGFQQISELLPIAGITYVGPLPADVQRITLVSAGVAVAAKNPDAARRLIRLFASPEAAAAIRAAGLEPVAALPR